VNAQVQAVVIGSGFGGSICALRLAQAGHTVMVLERGRRYAPADFPRDPSAVDRLLWRYPRHRRATGLFDLRFFSGLGVVVGSGVGGGSLIYAGVHIRPDPSVFEGWPDGLNRSTLEPYFDRVAAMLGVTPLPEGLRVPKRDAFHRAARAVAREIFDPPMAMTWSKANGSGGQACTLIAECEFGCPRGAKNTLDLTYLRQAEALGAQVRAGALASHIETNGKGYRVHFRDVISGRLEQVVTDRVVVAAGTLGTNELLLRSRDVFHTLKISSQLGRGFSGNGDFLGSIFGSPQYFEPWRGPDVTSVIRYPGVASFTMAAPTFAAAVMRVIAGLAEPPPNWARHLGPLLWPGLGWFITQVLRLGLWRYFPKGSPLAVGGTTNLFAIGRDNAGGCVVLRRRHLDVVWDYARENAALVNEMSKAMQSLAQAYGGRFLPLPTWTLCRRIISVHPLGGCRLSTHPDEGVVSTSGEVHGNPGLFVADGSLVPSSIGFHPAMTIAALAERTADEVAKSFS